MIEIRCDVCNRVVSKTKLVVSKTTPFVLGNGTLLNPENHVCIVCLALRLQAIAGRDANGIGKSGYSSATLNDMANQFAEDEILYRAEVVPPLDPALPPDYANLNTIPRRVEKGNRARSKMVRYEDGHDVRTLVNDAIGRMKTSHAESMSIDIHDHDNRYIGACSVQGALNMEGNHRIMANAVLPNRTRMFDSYSRSIMVQQLPPATWFDVVWGKFIEERSVYLRVHYKGVASIYVFFGSTKEQVRHLMTELKARVDIQLQSNSKKRIKE